MKQSLTIIIFLIALNVSLYGNTIILQNDEFNPTSLQMIEPDVCTDTILNDGPYPDMTIHLLLMVNGDTIPVPDRSVFQLNFGDYCMNFPIYDNTFVVDSATDLSTKEACLIISDMKINLILCNMTFEPVLRVWADNITLSINYFSDFVKAKKTWGSYILCDDIDTFQYFVLWGNGYVFDHVSVDCD